MAWRLIPAFLIIAIVVSFCGGSPSSPPAKQPAAPAPAVVAPEPPPVTFTPEQIKARSEASAVDKKKFCEIFGQTMRAKKPKSQEFVVAMIDRAEKEFGIGPGFVDDIRQRRPSLGMNSCAVLAAFGLPERANRSVSASAERYQLVYPDRHLYIYLTNDIVTSWQD